MVTLLLFLFAVPLPQARAFRVAAREAEAAVSTYRAVLRSAPGAGRRTDPYTAAAAARMVRTCFLARRAPASLCFVSSARVLDAAAWNALATAAGLVTRSERELADAHPRRARRLLRQSGAFLAVGWMIAKASRRLSALEMPVAANEDGIFRSAAARGAPR